MDAKGADDVTNALKRLEQAYELVEGGGAEPTNRQAASTALDEAYRAQSTLPPASSDAHSRAVGHLRNAIGFDSQPRAQRAQLNRAHERLNDLRASLGLPPQPHRDDATATITADTAVGKLAEVLSTEPANEESDAVESASDSPESEAHGSLGEAFEAAVASAAEKGHEPG